MTIYLVSADEFIGEGKTWHESSLLQPEDCGEGAREEDALYSCKGDTPRPKVSGVAADPVQSPLCFLGYAWQRLDCVEQEVPVVKQYGKEIMNVGLVERHT